MNFTTKENYSMAQNKKETEKYNYSSSPYSSSLPSPPYSEDNISSDEEHSKPQNNIKNQDTSANFMNESKVSQFASHSRQSWFGKNNGSEHKTFDSKKKLLSSPQFNKIYPNLLKNIDKSNAEPNSAPETNIKKSIRAKPRESIKCCVCYKKVRSREFKNHLYFGAISCSNCGASPKNCIDFVSFKSSPCCNKRRFIWARNPVQYLRENLLKNNEQVVDDEFRNALSDYINSLHSIQNVKPYAFAFKTCIKFIGPENYFTYTNSLENEQISPAKDIKSKNLKRNLEPIENIELPSDGYYLVVTEPIEECPNCYETLNPNNLIFNTTTWLITAKCDDCYLNIYFVLNPPDGSEPKIKILKGDS